MTLVIDDPKRVGAWVAERAHADGFNGDYQAIGKTDENGNLVAGLVFFFYRGHSVEIALRLDKPRYVSPKIYRYCLHFMFIECGCRRVYALIVDGHRKTERLLAGMNFQKEGVAPKAIRKSDGQFVDGAHWALLRENCTMIPEEYRHAKEID
jgi:RimJ/RimL family protein N-acetyltransferase